MSDATHLKEYQWKKGESGNLKGRPISIVKKIKEKFAADPDTFDKWINDYLGDRQNKKHIVEMLEGKPQQHTTVDAKIDVNNLSELTDEQLEQLTKQDTGGEGEEGVE